jgi:hypothetical protein
MYNCPICKQQLKEINSAANDDKDFACTDKDIHYCLYANKGVVKVEVYATSLSGDKVAISYRNKPFKVIIYSGGLGSSKTAEIISEGYVDFKPKIESMEELNKFVKDFVLLK